MKRTVLLAIMGIAILAFTTGQMCAPASPFGDELVDASAPDEVTGNNGGDNSGTDNTADDLSEAEKAAVVAACAAPGALGEGTQTAQNGTTDLDEDSGQSLPHEVTFGTCPQVTRSGALGAGVELTIDFGADPCTALVIEQDTYTCSGSATGALSLIDQSMELAFNRLDCNGMGIDGTADMTFELLEPGVAFEGSWDLTWHYGEEVIGATGSGTVSYVPVTGCCDVTSIEEFTGTVTEGDCEWSMTMEDILVSFEQYANLIPYSGSITLDGPDIRALTITFNENSPVTGEITICITGGRCLTTTLEELEEWAEALLGEVETE